VVIHFGYLVGGAIFLLLASIIIATGYRLCRR
jgi:hypothetical protein